MNRSETLTCTVAGLVLLASTLSTGLSTNSAPQGLDRLLFRTIGPATMGGRVDDVAVLEDRPSTFYVAAASGGLWKTVNNGTTWEPLFDDQDVSSIGAVAIQAHSASLVWVGTGENNNRQSSSWGSGVYKSTDSGRTWKKMGLDESRHTGRILIDPADHDVVYVASMGHLWGPNKERGVFKTTDGGMTWTQSLFVDENTGATDLVMDPSDNRVLYAATYQRQRSAWGFNGGGAGSGVYKSTDAGRSWARLTNGIPAAPLGRIGLDVYRRDPAIVFALIQQERESGLYRSDDAGSHWRKVSNINPRPMYFSKVRVDPNDAHRIYVLGVRLMVSDDAGKTFNEVRVSHRHADGSRPRDDLDLHAMWIDPNDSSHLVAGADIGVVISYDRGAAWDYVDNLPIGQFYHVGYDMETPYNVYGGLQDNDVWGGPSAVRNRWGIADHEWRTFAIGDGFAALADPRDSRTLYALTQNGNISRVEREADERVSIRPQPAKGDPPLRWAWDTPLVLSPHDSNTLLIGANRVFRSKDRGNSWEAISPDLTSGMDRDTMPLMGVLGKDIKISKHDGVSAYPVISTLAESPRTPGLYYAGTDDGMAYVSKDAGKKWINVSDNFPGRPARAPAGRLVPSAFHESAAFATFDNHQADDYAPYIYVTADYGSSWKLITRGLGKGQVVKCIAEDPRNPAVLYLGTEVGLFVSLDTGGHWTKFRSNLPTVPIDEIAIHPRDNDMLLATHGRSIWILDDLTPIQHSAEAMKGAAHLFGIRAATQFNGSNERANYPGDRRFWGQNPEFGAAITYYLEETAKDVKLTVRDAGGTVVREISGGDVKSLGGAGLNRVYWDLRHQPLESPTVNGPFVLPGEYRVTLSAGGREVGTRAVAVRADPRISISAADRRTHHDTLIALHELQKSINEASGRIATATGDVKALQDLLQRLQNRPANVSASAAALSKRLLEVNARLQAIRSQAARAKAQMSASTSLPTAAQMQDLAESREAFARLTAELNELAGIALPTLFRELNIER